MYIVCLDLEGVLVPEIWIAFAKETGIKELELTTRDIPDYDVLMKKRIGILKEHGLGIADIKKTIATIDPFLGAQAFLDELRSLTQVIILSDTFTQFASPLMEKLKRPTIFCNTLEIDSSGMVTGYKLRQGNGKYHAVAAFQSIGYQVIASGDSFNDLEMLRKAEKGFLFCPPQHIANDNPQFPAFTEYSQLLEAVRPLLAP
ncbi:MAG: bifunctional phosphoserine phosphatase/homoserine phosphotransferase ThrH [Spirochaetaceae bacterium]|jgi:phosphoserine/homoserine phosphotransferase|nr:bifunctional phosphoserine phosphatase/homoserine phosphotransferase ThrH [Spirochaetaceae bacterium]